MNCSLLETGGAALVVSQFTLYGDCRKGRRPSFINAARPEVANALYEEFITALEKRNVPTQGGTFQAMMDVQLINDGPVTILLDSAKNFLIFLAVRSGGVCVFACFSVYPPCAVVAGCVFVA